MTENRIKLAKFEPWPDAWGLSDRPCRISPPTKWPGESITENLMSWPVTDLGQDDICDHGSVKSAFFDLIVAALTQGLQYAGTTYDPETCSYSLVFIPPGQPISPPRFERPSRRRPF